MLSSLNKLFRAKGLTNSIELVIPAPKLPLLGLWFTLSKIYLKPDDHHENVSRDICYMALAIRAARHHEFYDDNLRRDLSRHGPRILEIFHHHWKENKPLSIVPVSLHTESWAFPPARELGSNFTQGDSMKMDPNELQDTIASFDLIYGPGHGKQAIEKTITMLDADSSPRLIPKIYSPF